MLMNAKLLNDLLLLCLIQCHCPATPYRSYQQPPPTSQRRKYSTTASCCKKRGFYPNVRTASRTPTRKKAGAMERCLERFLSKAALVNRKVSAALTCLRLVSSAAPWGTSRKISSQKLPDISWLPLTKWPLLSMITYIRDRPYYSSSVEASTR
jgi:hypothetical protein